MRGYRHGHGAKGGESPTYQTWLGMKQRCTNPRMSNYHRYGGRGITFCERWAKFANFLADMGVRPAGLCLDRIDNDGPYCKENCRWASMTQQTRNRVNNRLIEHRGEVLCVAEWASRLSIPAGRIRERLKRGWTIERALTN